LELGRDEEALALLGDHVLPAMLQGTGVNRCPATVYIRGLLGLCGHAASDRTRKNFKPRAQTEEERKEDTDAQRLIDDALEYFDSYDQGSYADHHPWVLALGGFVGASPLGTSRSERSTGTAVTSASRQAAQRKAPTDAAPDLLPTHHPVDAVMEHLLLTKGEKEKELAPQKAPNANTSATGSARNGSSRAPPITALQVKSSEVL